MVEPQSQRTTVFLLSLPITPVSEKILDTPGLAFPSLKILLRKCDQISMHVSTFMTPFLDKGQHIIHALGKMDVPTILRVMVRSLVMRVVSQSTKKHLMDQQHTAAAKTFVNR